MCIRHRALRYASAAPVFKFGSPIPEFSGTPSDNLTEVPPREVDYLWVISLTPALEILISRKPQKHIVPSLC